MFRRHRADFGCCCRCEFFMLMTTTSFARCRHAWRDADATSLFSPMPLFSLFFFFFFFFFFDYHFAFQLRFSSLLSLIISSLQPFSPCFFADCCRHAAISYAAMLTPCFFFSMLAAAMLPRYYAVAFHDSSIAAFRVRYASCHEHQHYHA